MRFLWLAHAVPYPPRAGFLLRAYYLLRSLAKRQPVDLIAFVQERWVRTFYPSLDEGLNDCRRALGEFCDSVTFLPIDRLHRSWGKQRSAAHALFTGTSYTTSWLNSSAATQVIAERLSASRYDLAHFDTLGITPYLKVCGEIPATLTHHNIESHMMLRRAENTKNVLARMYYRHEGSLVRRAEIDVASSISTHFTCSELDRTRLLSLVPDANAVVIPNGVDCEFFRSSDTLEQPRSLIFVGTMDWYPNVDAMVFFLKDVWPALRERLPDVKLDIVGSNPPQALLELARSCAGVTVHGYVPDVRPLIDAAAIVVCPIRDGGGTKLKVLDAFAMRKCVVAHPIACEGISVTPGLDVALAANPEEFAATLTELLGDPERRQRMGIAARSLVETTYSFDAIGERFTAIMEETARQRQTKAS